MRHIVSFFKRWYNKLQKMGPPSGSCDLREGGCVLTNYLDTHATCLLKPLKLFEGSSFLRTQRGVTSDMSWCARQVNPKERRKKHFGKPLIHISPSGIICKALNINFCALIFISILGALVSAFKFLTSVWFLVLRVTPSNQNNDYGSLKTSN